MEDHRPGANGMLRDLQDHFTAADWQMESMPYKLINDRGARELSWHAVAGSDGWAWPFHFLPNCAEMRIQFIFPHT
jgi:hypothetical protein